MKIAHISDLHLDKLKKPENFRKTLSLLEYIISKEPDHIVISGDITENADKYSFELTRSIFRKFGLLNKSKLTVVPGNHDIFGGVYLAEEILNFPAKCRETNYNRKLSEFIWWFRETMDEDNFPLVKEFDEVIIIGLNSVAEYSIIKNPLASNGKISNAQLKKLDEILKGKNKLKIGVTHHHFSLHSSTECQFNSFWNKVERRTMKLRRKKRVISKFLEHNISIVLHGHVHESAEYIKNGIKFINSGGSLMQEINTCSVYFIKTGNIQNIWMEKFHPYIKSNERNSFKHIQLFDEYGDPLSSNRKYSFSGN